MQNRVSRIDIVPSDAAIVESIYKDQAGRNDDLRWFIKQLDKTDGPYTYMIDASWGDGKTFFIKSVQYVLKAMNPNIAFAEEETDELERLLRLSDVQQPFLPIYFNAWENDFAEDPTTALLANMAVELRRMDFCKTNNLVEQIAAIIDIGLSLRGHDGVVTTAAEKLQGSSIIEDYEKKAQMRERVKELADTGIIEVANRLVLFVDELDRCRPDFAVRLLEQTKRLFDSENVILVFATDSRQLANAVGGMYGQGFETERFLQRFFDYRLRITPVEAFRVVTSRPLNVTYALDRFLYEIEVQKRLTMRDISRIQPKLDMVRRYCSLPGGGMTDVVVAARYAILPLLVVLENEDSELYRRIVGGLDFESLYEYGKQFSEFNSILSEMPCTTGAHDGTPESIERYHRSLMRSLCIFIYGDRDVVDVYGAGQSLGLLNRDVFNHKVFTRLIFDEVLPS